MVVVSGRELVRAPQEGEPWHVWGEGIRAKAIQDVVEALRDADARDESWSGHMARAARFVERKFGGEQR